MNVSLQTSAKENWWDPRGKPAVAQPLASLLNGQLTDLPDLPKTKHTSFLFSVYICTHHRDSTSLSLRSRNPRQTNKKNKGKPSLSAMACSGASLVALVAVIVTVLSFIGAAQAADAMAPTPTSPAPISPAFAISPSFLSTFFAALVALAFGSALRV